MYRGKSIKVWLLSLAFLATLPLFVFSIYTVYQLGKAQEHGLTMEMLQRTEATANSVSERIGIATSYLNGLAASNAALTDNLPELYEHARRIVRNDKDVRAITLVARDGRLLFITLRPYGSPGLPSNDKDALDKVFLTGKPAVSGPFKSPISDAIVTTVGVPIYRNGEVAYCLRMVILSDSLNALLAAQKLPADWTSAIIDSNGLLIARSRFPERFVGKEVSPTLMKALNDGKTGIFDTTTLDGVHVTTAVVPVPGWDWKVAIGVPAEKFTEPLRQSMGLLLLAGVFLVVVGVVASIKLSQVITQQVIDAVHRSKALESRGQQPMHRLHIKELDDLGQALRTVEAREQQTSDTLLDMAVRHEQVSAELNAALCDALTGLPGRSMFLERIEGLRKAGHDGESRKLAILFIDLDGFKQVNDTYGHDAGDRVLVRTAEILKELTREADIPGRLGGDEFVVCLSAPAGLIHATATSVAGRIVQEVSEIGNGIGCSVGISIWTGNCPDVGCVMRRADEAMYEAKRRGKNQYVIYGSAAKLEGDAWATPGQGDNEICTKCDVA